MFIPELTEKARCSSEIIRNGFDRGEENLWVGKENDFIEYTFDTDIQVNGIRLVFDSDLNRKYHNMPCNYPLVQTDFRLPETLIKEYKIQGFGENGEVKEIHVCDNHQRFVRHSVDWRVRKIRFIPLKTFGEKQFRLFDFEIE